jgi:hypothetical protein
MTYPAQLERSLAAAFLAGNFVAEEMAKRGARLLGRKYRWLLGLAERICAVFPKHRRPRLGALTAFIQADRGFLRAVEKYVLAIVHFPPRAEMTPIAAAQAWNIPQIKTIGQLAAWLQLTVRELEWFAQTRGRAGEGSSERLQHYHYQPVYKRFGQVRLIEAPKPRLKAIQRQLLIEILEPIPLHDTAHGFRSGRSTQSFAAPHVGQQVVLKIDLQDFFPKIARARASALFRSIGYSESVADLLTGLCTNRTPPRIWDEFSTNIPRAELRRVEALYDWPHLPQGAPTSPALANLCAYRLDCRLAALAAAAGGQYTRYADDLAFSGGAEFARSIDRFHVLACSIALEEGFAVHHRKTRIMRKSVRQQLTGLVVNQRLNIRRTDYDELKAILTNCARHGPSSQNRDHHPDFRAHLLGMISFVAQIHPGRGEKLRAIWRGIDWGRAGDP